MDITIGELAIEIRETMEIMADAIQYIVTTNATAIIEADDIDAAIELRKLCACCAQFLRGVCANIAA